jgi:hypothetical protein
MCDGIPSNIHFFGRTLSRQGCEIEANQKLKLFRRLSATNPATAEWPARPGIIRSLLALFHHVLDSHPAFRRLWLWISHIQGAGSIDTFPETSL